MTGHARRGYFDHLHRISAGDAATVARRSAVDSARAYHRAWAATDRLLPAPSCEVEPDGTLFCTWSHDGLSLTVMFMPSQSPFWWTEIGGGPWGGSGGDWDDPSSLRRGLGEEFGRIVGREPARVIPPPIPPPPGPGLLHRAFESAGLAAFLVLYVGLILGPHLLDYNLCLAIYGGILAAAATFCAGLPLWVGFLEARARRAERATRLKSCPTETPG